MVKDKFGPVAKLIPLSLVLFSFKLPLLSIFLQRVYGYQIFENDRHETAESASQVLVKELN